MDEIGVAPPAPARRRPTAWIVLAMALVVLLAAAGTVAVVQTRRLGQAREAVAEARREARDAEARASELAAAGADEGGADEGGADGAGSDGAGSDGGGSLLDDLMGEGGLGDALAGGGLGDLLEGLAGGGPDLTGCLTDVGDLPDVPALDLRQQVEDTSTAVEALRGLAFPDPIDLEVLDDAEIRDELAAEVDEAYTAELADTDQRLLAALRAIPAGTDLRALTSGLLGDQVAGFYDDTDGRLVVRSDGGEDPLGGVGLLTLAHELDHALVDATVGLPDLEAFGEDDDGATAALAVIEGSAVGLMTQFQVAALDPMALLGDLDALLGSAQGLDEVPAFLSAQLTFPYTAGPGYVCGLLADGGWPAVDAAIAAPPPTSHAILFPDDPVGEPVDPADAAGPAGYELRTRRTFGAAPLSWLLAAPGDDPAAALPDPVEAVRPWRGGEVALWTAGEDSAVGLALVGADLCGPVTDWWAAAGGPGDEALAEGAEVLVTGDDAEGWGVLTCDGEDVRLGTGPSLDVARAAAG